jgi:hypothetical protein
MARKRDSGLIYVDRKTALCVAGREAVRDAKAGYLVPGIYIRSGGRVSLTCDEGWSREDPDVYIFGLSYDSAEAKQARAEIEQCQQRKPTRKVRRRRR